MNKLRMFLLGLAIVIVGQTNALAIDKDAALALAKKSGCLACHSVDKKIVGPAWGKISEKYKGNAGSKAMLVTKVKMGGKGVWGNIPMPPNSPRVADADIEKLVDFVLSLAK